MAALIILLTWKAQNTMIKHSFHVIICTIQVQKVGFDQAGKCNSDRPFPEGHTCGVTYLGWPCLKGTADPAMFASALHTPAQAQGHPL